MCEAAGVMMTAESKDWREEHEEAWIEWTK